MNGRMDRVKAALRTYEELCSLSDLYAAALSNARNDISTLIKNGWDIEKAWMSHGVEAHRHYRLRHEPGVTPTPIQRRLIPST